MSPDLLVGVAAGSCFLALLILFSTGRSTGASEGAKLLSRGLRVYTANATGDTGAKRAKGQHPLAALATRVVAHVPKPDNYEERLQKRIDRSGWPLRASELLAIQAGAGLLGLLIGVAIIGTPWFAPIVGAIGVAIPRVLMTRRIGKRQEAFLEQLPDTLQLLAGSLQAGYGFLQAMDTLVRESTPPTSTEFGRVLAEIRLGMPVEDALTAMADRFGSEDLKWVVLAMNIQRQVGGNLATLLNTVAETLRDRERVRRQIQVLSAEGRLSAWILGLLPVGIAGYISMVNPGFLETLTSERIGQVMIVGAIISLGVGVAWMRKIIRIEV
jgi:tight adherence protein B